MVELLSASTSPALGLQVHIFKILQQVLYQLTLSLVPIIINKIYKVISLVVIQGECCFVECFSGTFRELFISALQFHN